ncbi:hypothetical protein C8Q74DRAFT_7601 [Fomes fomentarius]|nr:hypothetical protein C8Q74DRAFT_7601 [Fomes fomentarius]
MHHLPLTPSTDQPFKRKLSAPSTLSRPPADSALPASGTVSHPYTNLYTAFEGFESQWPIPSAHPPSRLMSRQSKNASRTDLRPCAPPHPHSRAVASRATLLRSVRTIRSGTHARLDRQGARESEGGKSGQLVAGVRVL